MSVEYLLKDKEESSIINSRTTLRLPDSIMKELKHMSIDENKTLTEIVIEALNQYLTTKKKEKAAVGRK